jgi:hypothetical protein
MADLGVTTSITYTVEASEGLPQVGASEPTKTDALCVGSGPASGGGITIPSTPHVDYFIDGATAASGFHALDPGSYMVTAQAQAEYELTGPSSWPLAILEQECIEFVGATVGIQAGTSVDLPSDAQPGDLAVVMVTRNGTTLYPTIPSGWTSWAQATSGSGTSQANSRLLYRVLQAGDTQVSWGATTFRSAVVVVYRNAMPGAAAPRNGNATTLPLTLQATDGTSWGGVSGWAFSGNIRDLAIAGLVSRTAGGGGSAGIGMLDSSGGVASWPSWTVTGAAHVFSFELRTAPPA